jgi:hypothetical protein
MENADRPHGPEEDLADWNRRRAEVARQWGVPSVSLEDDQEAPPVDDQLLRQVFSNTLPENEKARVLDYCLRYPRWCRVLGKIVEERYRLERTLREQRQPPA